MTHDELTARLQVKLASLPAKEALQIFIENFYRFPLSQFDRAKDEEMLLFEYGGPYSWSPHFEISCTRQFIFNCEDGEYDRMEQLRLQILFPPEIEQGLESGNFWNQDLTLEDFTTKVFTSAAWSTCKDIVPDALQLKKHEV
jgi:hypothetical protein